VPTSDPTTNGCPPDTDGDGFRDDKDACPEVKGVASDDPTKNGCPRVVFTAKEVVINQQIQFDVDRATIKPESNELLDEIASVIKAHPELKKIEVQGHTDNTATKQHNKILSGQRAEAVRKALVKRGVDTKILVAKGYGQEQPIADNATDAGKAKNRRVQFVILEKAPVGEDGKPLAPTGAAAPPAPVKPAPAAPAKPAPAKPAPAKPAAPPAKKPPPKK
jgi:outer membrane protein OmpA-like peptidoglycan-associated protein